MDDFNNNQQTANPAASGGTPPTNPATPPVAPVAQQAPAPEVPVAPVNDGTPTMNTAPVTPPPGSVDEKQPAVSKPIMIFAVIVILLIVGLLVWRFFIQDTSTASEATGDNNVAVVTETPETTLVVVPSEKKTLLKA